MQCVCGEQELPFEANEIIGNTYHRANGPCYKLEANLGLATTEELVNELIARFTLHYVGDPEQVLQMDRVVILAKFLGGLTALEKEYRTVDD